MHTHVRAHTVLQAHAARGSLGEAVGKGGECQGLHASPFPTHNLALLRQWQLPNTKQLLLALLPIPWRWKEWWVGDL